jgi:hypothetical protein
MRRRRTWRIEMGVIELGGRVIGMRKSTAERRRARARYPASLQASRTGPDASASAQSQTVSAAMARQWSSGRCVC